MPRCAMSRKPIAIDHFSVSQQLGFKKVYYCWCGASLDLNQNKHMPVRRWVQEHEACEMPHEWYGTYTDKKLAVGPSIGY
jgi:hypothetical protein